MMEVLVPMLNTTKRNKTNINFVFLMVILFLFVFTSLCSCKSKVAKEKIKGAKYKSISLLLKESRKANIHMDRKTSRLLIELISERTASEILSLNNEEKNEVLKIAITASIDLSEFFNSISKNKNSENFKENLLKRIDTNQNLSAIGVILSDIEYLKSGQIDCIMFAIIIMLSKATNVMGYDAIDNILKNGNIKDGAEVISKTNLGIVLYSYGIIKSRKDLNEVKFGQMRLLDILPEMRLNY